MNNDRPSGTERPSHQEFLRELAALDEAICRPEPVERARPPKRPSDPRFEDHRELVLPPPDMIAPRQPDDDVLHEQPRRKLKAASLVAALCGGLLGGGAFGLWLATSESSGGMTTERVARASTTKTPVDSRAVRPSARSRSSAAGAAGAARGATAAAAAAPIATPRVPVESASSGVISPPSPSSASSPDWIVAAAPTVTTELTAPPRALASHAGIPSAANVPVPLIAAPSNVSAAMSVVAADQAAIAATLRRYEQAYERLDAKAASAVWPKVDRRALSRAFAGLASQALDMRGCEVIVRAGASTATASCHGSAEYVRKVGDARVHVEPRQWTFTLNKTEGEWKIDAVDGQR